MKFTILVASLVLSTAAVAQSNQITSRILAQVTSVTPITTSVQVQQPCVQYQNLSEPSSINAKSIVGTLIGGVLGSQVGQGQGRDVAIALGAATGAMIGNESNRTDSRQIQQHCPITTEQRIVGYNVVASYQGVQITGQTTRQVSVGSQVEINVVSSFRMVN
jgi:uncharacterized protein YcfJ